MVGRPLGLPLATRHIGCQCHHRRSRLCSRGREVSIRIEQIRRCALFCRRADECIDFIAFDGDQVVGRKLQFEFRAEKGGWFRSSTATWPDQPPAERIDVRAAVVPLADACLLPTSVYLGRVSMMIAARSEGQKSS